MTASEKHGFVDRIKSIEERLLIIVNPMSKKGSVLASSVRSTARREGMNLEETSTDLPADIGSTVQFWSKRFGGSRVIMVFGGDGAINQVINNVMLSRSNKNVVLVPIPAGTANDFCRALDLDDVEDTLEAMVDFNIRSVDLLRIEVSRGTEEPPQVKYCSNIIGFGLDGELAERSQKYKRFGVLGYWYASLKTALFNVFRGMNVYRVKLEADGRVYEGRILDMMCSNIDKYGHDLLVAPGAKPDDGRIYICIAEEMTIFKALPAGVAMLWGLHDRFSTVKTFNCDAVKIVIEDDMYTQEDGEVYFYPRGTTFDISIEPGALNVLSASPALSNGS